jgi:hypothetical protein
VGVLEILIGAGAKAVERNADAEDAELAHGNTENPLTEEKREPSMTGHVRLSRIGSAAD